MSKELDEARKQIRMAIGRSCDYEAHRKTLQDKDGNIRPINDVGAGQILNLKGENWKIAIVGNVIQKAHIWEREILWEAGDK